MTPVIYYWIFFLCLVGLAALAGRAAATGNIGTRAVVAIVIVFFAVVFASFGAIVGF